MIRTIKSNVSAQTFPDERKRTLTRSRIISWLRKMISGLNDLSAQVYTSERLRGRPLHTNTNPLHAHIHWSNIPLANLWWKPELNENRGTQAPSPLIRSPSTTCTAHQKDKTLWSDGAPSFICWLKRPKRSFLLTGLKVKTFFFFIKQLFEKGTKFGNKICYM